MKTATRSTGRVVVKTTPAGQMPFIEGEADPRAAFLKGTMPTERDANRALEEAAEALQTARRMFGEYRAATEHYIRNLEARLVRYEPYEHEHEDGTTHTHTLSPAHPHSEVFGHVHEVDADA